MPVLVYTTVVWYILWSYYLWWLLRSKLARYNGLLHVGSVYMPWICTHGFVSILFCPRLCKYSVCGWLNNQVTQNCGSVI